jgi:hypothetical protein
LATATLDHYTPVDALVGYYLREIGWKPNGEQVAILNKHPEPNIRFASYLATFDLANKATGLQLLQEALKREDVEDYRTQLEQMVRRLQPPEHS